MCCVSTVLVVRTDFTVCISVSSDLENKIIVSFRSEHFGDDLGIEVSDSWSQNERSEEKIRLLKVDQLD